jgi:hypothetical protein
MNLPSSVDAELEFGTNDVTPRVGRDAAADAC